MAHKEKTGSKVAEAASKILRSPTASKAAKRVAGSGLSQASAGKQTSARVAKTPAKVLSTSTSKPTKSVAASVLTQKHKKT